MSKKCGIQNTKNYGRVTIDDGRVVPPRPSSIILSSIVIFFLTSAICFLTLAGCNKANEKAQLLDKIDQLTEQNAQLTSRIEQTESQNRQLTEQVNVLSSLPEKIKSEKLYTLKKINIHRFTGFYDKNNDGKKETLIVHLQPIDEQLDVIKAIGEVNVQLWDLNQPEDQALIRQWNIGPEELQKTWITSMFTISYRLPFNVSKIVENFDKPYTVKVKFTDYMSGRIFENQTVIKP
jgi:cell division protein FtsB